MNVDLVLSQVIAAGIPAFPSAGHGPAIVIGKISAHIGPFLIKEIAGRLTVATPIIKDAQGRMITGSLTAEIMVGASVMAAKPPKMISPPMTKIDAAKWIIDYIGYCKQLMVPKPKEVKA